ncbi:MAG: efflux transporter outer membrane subunit [Phycisphaerales bacterium]|nr:efflux transporter outer membrane subunit [Phycisphaerales bacterium]
MSLAAVFAGCTVGPNYAPPMPEVPASWQQTLAGGPSSASAEAARWWTTLNDPKLNELIDRAVAGNLDLRAARARLREARAQRGVVAADFWPSADASGSYSRGRNSASTSQGRFSNFGEYDNFQTGFDATWELDVFGRTRRGVEAAEAEIASAAENIRDVLVSLTAEVAANYVDLRSSQRRLEIASNNVRVQQSTVELAESRFKAGIASELDLARARSNLASTQAQIPSIRAAVDQSARRLAVLSGRNPGDLLAELSEARPIPPIPPSVPVGLPSDLLRRRPDIRRAERDIAAATARIGVATADLFPRFSLTGQFGFASSEVGEWFDSPARFWSFGPAVRWNFFSAGRVRSNIAVQEARADQATIRYQQAVLTALEDAENSLTNYAREQTRRTSLAESVAAEQRAVDLANELFTKGLTDFLSVLDSQRQLYALQDQLVVSERQVTTNLISLYKALGGGWEAIYPDTPPPPEPRFPSPLPDALAPREPRGQDSEIPPGPSAPAASPAAEQPGTGR